jgi:hypothetical protein
MSRSTSIAHTHIHTGLLLTSFCMNVSVIKVTVIGNKHARMQETLTPVNKTIQSTSVILQS